MGCCGDSAKVNAIQLNGRELSPKNYDDEFEGLAKNRSCTDVICLILFLLFCTGGIVYLVICVLSGDPDRLIHGYDNYGNVCGKVNERIAGVPQSGKDKTNLPYCNVEVNNGQKRKTCVVQCPSGTTQVGFRCFPDAVGKLQELEETQKITERIKDFFEKCINNIKNSWEEILAICLIGLAISIIVILLLRFFAGIIVWITIVVIVVASVAGTIALWILWNNEGATKNKKWFLVGAIVATILTVLLIILLIALRNRIRLVIQLFKESAKAIMAMPFLLLQPIWTILVMIIVLGVWMGGWIPILSSGEFVSENNRTATLKMDKVISGMRAYHIFGLLWVMQFVMACQSVTIAGAVGIWYFRRDKSKLGTPIFTSMGNLVRYHLGSVAFGALIIAIVQFLRLILKYIEQKTSGVNEGLKWCLRCCQCCLWCFEKFLKFLNRNAYIQIAIFGYSFCKGARNGFAIIAKNALRVGTLNFVGEFIFFLIKIAVVAITVVIGKFIMETNKDVDSIVPSLVVAGIITYLIIYCFVSVFEMTIDTLLICFCEDCERNDGLQKPYYMNRDLMKYVENSKKALEALDQREADGKNNNLHRQSINTIQIPPDHQKHNSPGGQPARYNSSTSHGNSGMTPLHAAYPPVSQPPTPSKFMSRPE